MSVIDLCCAPISQAFILCENKNWKLNYDEIQQSIEC